MDITVLRNGFGRQQESFEADLEIPALGEPPMRGVFIRAPIISAVGEGVEVLAQLPEHRSVAVARQGRLLAATFHPELTSDDRLHHYFLQI
jgi:5'-phosphate synthase pdxT subunit